jgi:hypothetical protein
MIITREISININESNYSYYEELGYEVTIGERLLIPIELLSTGSHQKINCKCDGCGISKEVIFKNYVKYGNKWGEYFCRKCSEVKRKRTLNLNYGVDYPIQSKEIKKRIKKTMIEKWGVDNPSKSAEIIKGKKNQDKN